MEDRGNTEQKELEQLSKNIEDLAERLISAGQDYIRRYSIDPEERSRTSFTGMFSGRRSQRENFGKTLGDSISNIFGEKAGNAIRTEHQHQAHARALLYYGGLLHNASLKLEENKDRDINKIKEEVQKEVSNILIDIYTKKPEAVPEIILKNERQNKVQQILKKGEEVADDTIVPEKGEKLKGKLKGNLLAPNLYQLTANALLAFKDIKLSENVQEVLKDTGGTFKTREAVVKLLEALPGQELRFQLPGLGR